MALRLEANEPKLLLLKANILASQQNYAGALKCLATLIGTDPKNGEAYLSRALIYAQQGEWDNPYPIFHKRFA